MKPNIFIATIIYVGALTACMHRKHVTIATNTNGSYKKVEYTGLVTFTQNQDVQISMSPQSWLKYKENDLQLKVECDESGSIYYSLNGDAKSVKPTAEEKSILARAARLVADFSAKPSHS